MVFYRKYRPQTIEELDIAQVRQSLSAILSSGKIPHALLFTGPQGLGKTSAARIVAKSVNCLEKTEEQKSLGEPCNRCDVCLSITEGRNLDVFEIDGASNRGIDEIRDLREKIKLAPTSSRYKVYIIDEVHMLTTEAFNALLKTLEEPPPHAIFILCTTEAHKLPLTIISRCLRFDFKRASKEDLLRSLERVVKGENLKVEKDALGEIAHGAGGSFRDAVKILEQATFSGQKITQEQVREILGQTQNLKPQALLELLTKKDTRGAVLEINRLVEAGENLRVYTEKFLDLLHQILMMKVGVEEESLNTELVSQWEKGSLMKLIELFSRAYGELKAAAIPQLPLELAVIEWCEEGMALSPAEETALRKQASSNLFVARKGSTQKSVDSLQDEPSGRAQHLNRDDMSQLWPQIIDVAKAYNHTLSGVLRGCRPQGFDGKILIIETTYQFHKDRLDDSRSREILAKIISQVFGKPVGFKCVLGKKER